MATPLSVCKLCAQLLQLFDFLAECIAAFVKDNNLTGRVLPLGFTFSFPCKQEGLAVGRLIHWSKGFSCSGVEGRDVGRLLQEAICRRKVLSAFVSLCVSLCVCYNQKIVTARHNMNPSCR